MSARLRHRVLLGMPGLALAAVVMVAVSEGHEANRLLNAVQAGLGLVLIWGVAVAVQLRYPDRPLGRLLFALAVVHGALALQVSDSPVLFSLARLSRPSVELLLVWIMLSFPSGRLVTRLERGLVMVVALALVFLWLPAAMLSAQIPMAGPFVQCGADCPRNVLLVAERPELSQALVLALRTLGVIVMVATAGVLYNRLRKATPLMRRVLAPVLLASIARAVVTATWLAGGSSRLAFGVTFFAVPLAIALGLLRSRLDTARALQHLVGGLRSRPDTHELREVMASALGDASLTIAYWINDAEHWVDADARVVARVHPPSAVARAVTLVRDEHGWPVAALTHDVALLEEPTLIESVTGSMQVALESHRLEAEVNAASARSASAVEAERHRIERDLHDGAQQRLIALRMKLGVTARLLEQHPRRAAALVDEMGGDVEAAMVELRALAHGIAPPLLVERGLGAALTDAARCAALPTRAEIDEVGRLDADVERAVYFCCVEALQNAAKHAGPGATANLSLRRDGDVLAFRVTDDGAGVLTTGRTLTGHGLSNMRERIGAVGGRLDVRVRSGAGFAVEGCVAAGFSGVQRVAGRALGFGLPQAIQA